MADGGTQPLKAKQAYAPEGPGVHVIMRAQAIPGLEDRFEALLTDLAYTIRTEEPGCLSYTPTKPIGASTHFAVHARFADFATFERHAEGAHLERAMPRLAPLLAAPISLEIFVDV